MGARGQLCAAVFLFAVQRFSSPSHPIIRLWGGYPGCAGHMDNAPSFPGSPPTTFRVKLLDRVYGLTWARASAHRLFRSAK